MFAIEVGGRWSDDAARFLRLLAKAKGRQVPQAVRAAAVRAYLSRWSAIVACTAQRAFAASLLSLPLEGSANLDGQTPELGELLDAERFESAPAVSRLPG